MELHRRVLPFFISFPPVYCHFLSFSLFFSLLSRQESESHGRGSEVVIVAEHQHQQEQ